MSGAFSGYPPGHPGSTPGGVPGAPGAQATFVLNIPADPTWEPIDASDTLDMDGYYKCRIKSEKLRTENGKNQIILTLDILDQDAIGKTLTKFMPDPTQTTKDSWFVWRGLLRSITGNLDAARSGMQYTLGCLIGSFVYARTGAYADNQGTMRTGVENFEILPTYEEAVKSSRHRWPAKIKGGAGGQSPVGALPTGLPGGFPGMGVSLPGSPAGAGPFAPAPAVASPMVQPQQQAFVPPQQQVAAPVGFPVAPVAPPAGFGPPQPVAPPTPFAFQPGAQAVAAPPQSFTLPPPPPPAPAPANGAPMPGNVSPFPAFPGMSGPTS